MKPFQPSGWKWETEEQALCEAPLLTFAGYIKSFVLHTDASSRGLGAFLYQKQEGQLKFKS